MLNNAFLVKESTTTHTVVVWILLDEHSLRLLYYDSSVMQQFKQVQVGNKG